MANEFNQTLNNLVQMLMQQDMQEKELKAKQQYYDNQNKQMELALQKFQADIEDKKLGRTATLLKITNEKIADPKSYGINPKSQAYADLFTKREQFESFIAGEKPEKEAIYTGGRFDFGAPDIEYRDIKEKGQTQKDGKGQKNLQEQEIDPNLTGDARKKAIALRDAKARGEQASQANVDAKSKFGKWIGEKLGGEGSKAGELGSNIPIEGTIAEIVKSVYGGVENIPKEIKEKGLLEWLASRSPERLYPKLSPKEKIQKEKGNSYGVSGDYNENILMRLLRGDAGMTQQSRDAMERPESIVTQQSRNPNSVAKSTMAPESIFSSEDNLNKVPYELLMSLIDDSILSIKDKDSVSINELSKQDKSSFGKLLKAISLSTRKQEYSEDDKRDDMRKKITAIQRWLG